MFKILVTQEEQSTGKNIYNKHKELETLVLAYYNVHIIISYSNESLDSHIAFLPNIELVYMFSLYILLVLHKDSASPAGDSYSPPTFENLYFFTHDN